MATQQIIMLLVSRCLLIALTKTVDENDSLVIIWIGFVLHFVTRTRLGTFQDCFSKWPCYTWNSLDRSVGHKFCALHPGCSLVLWPLLPCAHVLSLTWQYMEWVKLAEYFYDGGDLRGKSRWNIHSVPPAEHGCEGFSLVSRCWALSSLSIAIFPEAPLLLAD